MEKVKSVAFGWRLRVVADRCALGGCKGSREPRLYV